MYTATADVRNQIPTLPHNLLDAIRETQGNKVLYEALNAEFMDAYINTKNNEWNEFMSILHEWERTHTIDC